MSESLTMMSEPSQQIVVFVNAFSLCRESLMEVQALFLCTSSGPLTNVLLGCIR